ncbi:MAG: hypothetical protein H0U50_14605 [Pyrinomonadaceae bacterium]|nr:hypothetical protein [Pyrinomonadaceae bacterium]
MKKLGYLLFSAAMMFSLVFISDAISSNSPFSVKAQTGQVTVRRRNKGIARRTASGAKYVGRKTVQGTKYVGKKTVQGGKYVGKKTVQGTRYTAHKTKRGAKATVNRAKKILY